MENSFGLVESLFRNDLALIIQVTIKPLQIDKGKFRRFLNLAHNFFSKLVEVLLGVHELLMIDHGVQITDDKKPVLATSNIHTNLVHGDILGVAAIRILLHLGVIFLHGICIDVEREGSSLLNVIQEVPRSRLV